MMRPDNDSLFGDNDMEQGMKREFGRAAITAIGLLIVQILLALAALAAAVWVVLALLEHFNVIMIAAAPLF